MRYFSVNVVLVALFFFRDNKNFVNSNFIVNCVEYIIDLQKIVANHY